VEGAIRPHHHRYPPVLAMTDAVRMSVEADSVILVMRSGLIERTSSCGLRMCSLRSTPPYGFVLNGAELDSSDFRYFYGYYGRDESKHLSEGA